MLPHVFVHSKGTLCNRLSNIAILEINHYIYIHKFAHVTELRITDISHADFVGRWIFDKSVSEYETSYIYIYIVYIKRYGKMEVQHQAFLNPVLDGRERSASRVKPYTVQ
jgi:hypothetical protein